MKNRALATAMLALTEVIMRQSHSGSIIDKEDTEVEKQKRNHREQQRDNKRGIKSFTIDGVTVKARRS